jgi:hypothetical protein
VTTQGSSECAGGDRCQNITVTCPGVERDIRGRVAVAAATAPTRGVLVFFSGGSGTVFWSDEQGEASELLDRLRGEGFTVVQVKWGSPWLASAPGEKAGPAALACRSATIARWVWEKEYAPLGLGRVPGRCGFCIIGSSGGASQAAYTVTAYRQAAIVDGLVSVSGPVHAALDRACLRNTSDRSYWYLGPQAKRIDMSYGYRGGGPCERNDAGWADRWRADSADRVGSFSLRSTRVVVIVGGKDTTGAVPHARDYYARLKAAGSTRVSIQEVASMGHAIQESPEGMTALERALVAGPSGPVASLTPTPTPEATPPRSGTTVERRRDHGQRPILPYVVLVSVAAVATTSFLVKRALQEPIDPENPRGTDTPS